MKRVGNKLEMEQTKCLSCNGSGKVDELRRCIHYGKQVRGVFPNNKCPDCGSTSKLNHKAFMTTGKQFVCGSCNGSGIVMERLSGYLPDEIWKSLTFKVYRSDRPTSWAESYIGAGCFSCVDYGLYKKLSDEELINKVKGNTFVQALKVANKDYTLADHIGIITSANGYSVVAFNADGSAISF